MVDEGAVANPSTSSLFQSPGGSAVLPPFQAAVIMPSRERFYVELKPDETTVVSWKKLLKDSQKNSLSSGSEAPAGAHPALEARIAPEVGGIGGINKDPLPPPPNRFNSVIEKIERLYKGGHSSDENENLSDVPDDDQYDTSDSFIDDEELNEYFSVDKAKTKHTGFFINRGKLERESEPAAAPVPGPKKRKRRDIKKLSSEIIPDDLPQKLLKSGVRMKAAARKVPLSTVGASGALDKSQILMSASSQPMTPREISSGTDLRPLGSESGKVEEDSSVGTKSEHINVIPNNVVTYNAKESIRDAAENREVVKTVVHERPRESQLISAATELPFAEKIDTSVTQKKNPVVQSDPQTRDLPKETMASSLSKVKVAQKGIRDDDVKETIGGGGKLVAGNVKSSPPNGNKDVSPGRPKGTVLERAIQDLARGVAELCPPSLDVQEPEQISHSGGKTKRLPRDVKQKLAKVARLAAKQGRISDELIERLMGILGHVMRVKTLKRNLKEMVEMGLSAMQEKEGRLKDMKKAVTEMVKTRVSSLQAQEVEQREGLSDDFQAIPGSGEKGGGQYQWDYATEDRICDLYEQYLEGMDEHRGPKLRKFYAEVAELWPEGWMDNIGIKHAVHRAKERKKKLKKLGSCREESRRKRRASVKRKQEEYFAEGTLSFLSSPADQGKMVTGKASSNYDYHLEESMPGGCIVWPGDQEKQDYWTKSSDKGSNGIEKKRNRLEGCSLFRKKLKRKLERGMIDVAPALSPKKSFSTNSAQIMTSLREQSSRSI